MKLTFTLLLALSGLLPGLALAHAAGTLEFVENRGQWDKRACFGAPLAPGARLFAEAGGLTYVLTAGLPEHGLKPTAALAKDLLPAHALRVEFVGAIAGIMPAGEAETPGRQHYLLGNDARQWASNARVWHRLRYRQLWPGTDLLLKASTDNELEYDLLLDAGADPNRLCLRYHGAETLTLDPQTGFLQVKTSVGQLTEQAPRAWQTDPATGQRQPVRCDFQLKNGEVSFRLGAYDRRRALVIDPVVQFVTYSGARTENWGFAATHDAAGNLYTTGVAFGPGYPTTTGAYQASFAGNTDIVVMKFNTTQTGPGARAWTTYLGGNGFDFPHSLLVNVRNELLLLGTTGSTNYPTTPTAAGRTFRGGPAVAPDPSFNLSAGVDVVLTRLSADGGRLRAGTYLGGTGTDGLLDPAAPAPRLRYNFGDSFRGDLTLDPQGNVYVATTSSSANFPGLATGAYRGGPADALVTSLDSTMARVRWTTAVGGSGEDAAYSLQRDEVSGDLFVSGGTTSANLSGATGGYQSALSGSVDGFVARLQSASGRLVQATYLGTVEYDQAYFVRRGPTHVNFVYVLGQTAGAWPTTAGVYQNQNGRQFIQQLTDSLTRAGFATVFGAGRSMPDISPTAFEVDCYGRLYLAGWGGGRNLNGGNTQGLPVTPNALQGNTDGRDFYLMQLSDGAQVLDYASFFGSADGDHVDGGSSRFDPQGTLYQAVCACQSNRGLPIPLGANYYQNANAAPGCDNAAFKFALAAGTAGAGPDTMSVCARAGAIRLGGSPAGGTWTGTGVTGSVAGGFYFSPDTLQLGPHVLTYTSPLTGLCAGTSTRRITVLPQGRAALRSPQDTFCLVRNGPAPAPVLLTGRPAGGSFSGAGLVPGPTPGSYQFDPVAAGPGIHMLTYRLGGGRCPALAALQMVVRERTKIIGLPPGDVCINDPIIPLMYGTPAGGTWTGPGVTGTVNNGFTFNPQLAGTGSHLLVYTVPAELTCDSPADSVRIRVLPAGPPVRVPQDTALCSTAAPFRLRDGVPAGGTWSGAGVTGNQTTGFIFTPRPGLAGQVSITYTGPVTSPDTCAASARRIMLLRETLARVSMPNRIVCALAGPQPLSADPPGGTWSGPGVSGSVATGYFFMPSPALVGQPHLQYVGPTPANPTECPSAAELVPLVVEAPRVVFDSIAALSLCQGFPPHGIQLSAQPPGGTFAGPGVALNQFNPGIAGIGRHLISYTYLPPGLDCPITVQRTAVVTDVPVISLPPDTVLCASFAPFVLRASPSGGVWSGPGVTAAGIFTPPATPGTSVLTYALGGGCGERFYRVTVPEAPTFGASWVAPGCDANLVAPRLLRFTATGPAAERVQWDFGDGSAPVTGAVVEHNYTAAGDFQPRAALPGASPTGPCQTQLTLPSLTVQATVLPNIITPNGDPLNEYFAPRVGGCTPRLQVFSRWGRQVFEQAAYQNNWNGAGLPAGLYYYLLTDPATGRRLKGWVEIMR
jgi:hypothetical protein